MGTRPRVGFSPNRPQHEAGILIEPPPSLPCAIGTTRLATRAADPPEDPPLVRSRFHGLRVLPNSTDSVVVVRPNSGIVTRVPPIHRDYREPRGGQRI